MITKEEIDAFACDLQVNASDIQRDYVNGAVLASVFAHPRLSRLLVLKGGNALRKGYFSNTRYSRDLDFSTPGAISHDDLRQDLAAVCAEARERTGVTFLEDELTVQTKKRVLNDLSVVEVRAYFLDFHGKKRPVPIRIYMDVTEYDKLLLAATDRRLIHPYSDAENFAANIRCSAVEEILASKLKCLLQRRHAADLYDYIRWLMYADVEIDRQLLFKTFLKKTIYHRSPGVALRLLTALPRAAFSELWSKHIVAPRGAVVAFHEGIERFMGHLRVSSLLAGA